MTKFKLSVGIIPVVAVLIANVAYLGWVPGVGTWGGNLEHHNVVLL